VIVSEFTEVLHLSYSGVKTLTPATRNPSMLLKLHLDNVHVSNTNSIVTHVLQKFDLLEEFSVNCDISQAQHFAHLKNPLNVKARISISKANNLQKLTVHNINPLGVTFENCPALKSVYFDHIYKLELINCP
jgi:hypothetical protein